MRRLLIFGCLIGLGWLVWLLWRNPAAARQAAATQAPDAFEEDEPAPAPVPKPQVTVEDAAVPQATGQGEPDAVKWDEQVSVEPLSLDEPAPATVPEPQRTLEDAAVPQAVIPAEPNPFERSEPHDGSTEAAGDWDAPAPAPATVPEPPGTIEDAAVLQAAAEPYQLSDRQQVSSGDGERLLAELAQVRSEIVEKVERRPLFVMAEERGVPFFRLFFMSKPELLEAILEAERVPPPDVLPSAEAVERVRELALEVFRRNDEIAAEEWGAAG